MKRHVNRSNARCISATAVERVALNQDTVAVVVCFHAILATVQKMIPTNLNLAYRNN